MITTLLIPAARVGPVPQGVPTAWVEPKPQGEGMRDSEAGDERIGTTGGEDVMVIGDSARGAVIAPT